MNHRLFEEWLFADEPLEPEQLNLLHEHLRNCDYCTQLFEAWRETEGLLKAASIALPEAGFTNRWQLRWAAEQLKRQHRQTMLMLAFYLGGAVFMLFMLGIMLLPFLFSPQPIILALLYRLTMWFGTGEVIFNFGTTLMSTIFGVLPPTLWVGMGVALASLCVLWIVTLRKLTSTRRVFA